MHFFTLASTCFDVIISPSSESWMLVSAPWRWLDNSTEICSSLLGITKLDKEKNQCIREKTGAQNIVKEINSTRKSGYNTYRGWTQTEYQKKALHYKPKRRRNIERPRKKRRGQFHFEDQGTGNTPNPSWTWWWWWWWWHAATNVKDCTHNYGICAFVGVTRVVYFYHLIIHSYFLQCLVGLLQTWDVVSHDQASNNL
jgi:hypothetical protein